MCSHPINPDNLPDPVRDRLRNYSTDGLNLKTESSSDVYLLTHPLKAGLILKTRDIRARPPEPDLLTETVALTWLRDKLPVPECRCFHVEGDTQYLLMTHMDGVTGIHPEMLEHPEHLVGEFARGLREVHGLDTASCPLDWRMPRFLSRAEELIESGALDDQVSDGENRTYLLEKLSDIKETVPGEEDLVMYPRRLLPAQRYLPGRRALWLHRPGLRGGRRPVPGSGGCARNDPPEPGRRMDRPLLPGIWSRGTGPEKTERVSKSARFGVLVTSSDTLTGSSDAQKGSFDDTQ